MVMENGTCILASAAPRIYKTLFYCSHAVKCSCCFEQFIEFQNLTKLKHIRPAKTDACNATVKAHSSKMKEQASKTSSPVEMISE